MSINLTSPTVLSSLLLGDRNSGNLTLTQVNGVPVNAILELQTTEGALLVPRMTTAQRDALTTVCPGMVIYNTTTNSFNFRENAAWSVVGAGSVSGPGASVNNTMPVWDGITGTLLKGSTIVITNDENITDVKTVVGVDGGTAALPVYTFAGRTDTGMWSSADNVLDFSGASVRQFQITSVGAATDYLSVAGSAVGSPRISALSSNADTNLALEAKGNGWITINGTTTNPAIVRFYTADNTSYSALQGPTPGANITFTLPAADAAVVANSTYTPLCSNGAGVLSFADQGIRVASGTVSSAQILALNATPATILPAPGANKTIVINNFVIRFNHGGIAYLGGGNLVLVYNVLANTATTAIPASVLTGATDEFGNCTGLTGSYGDIANVSNIPIKLTVNGGVDFTTGNGTITWYCYYSILPI